MRDVREQIKALGGPTRVAQELAGTLIKGKPRDCSVAAVIMWSYRNWVPYNWKAPFGALVTRRQRAEERGRDRRANAA